MGKNGYSLFDCYMESLTPNENKVDSISLPDSMRTSTLLEQIGKDRSWTSEQVDDDIAILEKNRLYLVRDLRVLSNHSWSVIDILPIVRDLLKQAIHPNGTKQRQMAMDDSSERWIDNSSMDYKAEKKMKKMKKKDKKDKKRKMGEPVVPTKMMGGRDEVALAEHLDNASLLASPDVVKDMFSDDPETIRNTIRNGSIDVGKENLLDTMEQQQQEPLRSSTTNHSDHHQQKKSVSFSNKNGIIPQQQQSSNETTEKTFLVDSSDDISSSSSSSSSNSSDDDNITKNRQQQQQQQKETSPFGLRPIKPVSANRIQVKTATGQVYECDRFCPHKGVDLSTWGQVLGDGLVCTKHSWRFSLDDDGSGNKGRSIHPCKVNDW